MPNYKVVFHSVYVGLDLLWKVFEVGLNIQQKLGGTSLGSNTGPRKPVPPPAPALAQENRFPHQLHLLPPPRTSKDKVVFHAVYSGHG